MEAADLREALLAPTETIERSVYRVQEYEWVDVPLHELLSDGQLDFDSDLAGRFFSFHLHKLKLTLQAQGFIGLIPINDRVAIEVSPRCPIANLMRVLQVGGFAPEIIERYARDYATEHVELPDLRDFYAQALLDEVAQIEAFGRLREYRQRTERTTSPRGRLLFRAPETQLAAAGASASVRASWFERTADTPANRCLKIAVWLLGRSYAQSRDLAPPQRRLAARLNDAHRIFEDAFLDFRLGFLADPLVLGTTKVPATRAYYRNALDVARLIVSSSSLHFDRAGSDVRMPSVLVAMDDVFEAYVRNVLRAGLGSRRPDVRVLDGNKGEGRKLLFDAPPSEHAKPDVVIATADGPTPVVMDVKYKPARRGPDRSDLNQVIAYGASYRADVAVVVQPRASDAEHNRLVHLGDIKDLRICQYVLDLDGDLEEEESAMVAAVDELVPPGAETASEAVPVTAT